STDPPVWDDPQTMFVGSIDGSITGGTGAGPDAPPVAKAARAYGRNASAVTGIDAGWIAQQLYNGNPVIMFGAFSRTGTITWKTPSGDTRIMNLTGHATTVTGVKGEPSNPIGFWVNDPLRGASYWTTAQVNANIALDPDRQAVVIY
ncbi:C39 family peptidase, partial [Candidatus Saccharibacteria bacterium]|nr:C39 family peptidase [Candidatus Saccharibacteria bacterium]